MKGDGHGVRDEDVLAASAEGGFSMAAGRKRAIMRCGRNASASEGQGVTIGVLAPGRRARGTRRDVDRSMVGRYVC